MNTTTNTRGVSEAMVDEGCAAFSRLQGRQTSTCIHGGTHTMTELRKAMRAALEAALSAPEPAAQGEAGPKYPNNAKLALQFGYARGFIAATKWPAPVSQDVHSPAFRQECDAFVESNAPLYTALSAQPAERVPDAVVVPYGSESGEKDYAYGYEKGRADGWNACRDAMLTASHAPSENRTIYDHRVRIDEACRDAAPQLYWALKNLLDAVKERPDNMGIESVVTGDAENALLAAASPAPSEGGKGVDRG